MPALDLFTIISMGMCTVDPVSEIENNFYDLWWGPAPAHKQGDPDFRNKEYKDVDEFPAPCAFDPNGVIDSNEKIAHLLSSSIWDEDPAGYYGDGDDVDFYIHFSMSTSDEEDEFEEDDVPVAHESYLNDENDVIDFDTTLELLPSNIGSRKAAALKIAQVHFLTSVREVHAMRRTYSPRGRTKRVVRQRGTIRTNFYVTS